MTTEWNSFRKKPLNGAEIEYMFNWDDTRVTTFLDGELLDGTDWDIDVIRWRYTPLDNGGERE